MIIYSEKRCKTFITDEYVSGIGKAKAVYEVKYLRTEQRSPIFELWLYNRDGGYFDTLYFQEIKEMEKVYDLILEKIKVNETINKVKED